MGNLEFISNQLGIPKCEDLLPVVGTQYLDTDILLAFQVCLFTLEPIKNNHIFSVSIQSTGSF